MFVPPSFSPALSQKLAPQMNYTEQHNDESEHEEIHEDDNAIVGETERRRDGQTNGAMGVHISIKQKAFVVKKVSSAYTKPNRPIFPTAVNSVFK